MRCFNLLGAVVDEAEERFRVPLIFTCQARFKFLRAIYIPRVIISIDVGACPARKKKKIGPVSGRSINTGESGSRSARDA